MGKLWTSGSEEERYIDFSMLGTTEEVTEEVSARAVALMTAATVGASINYTSIMIDPLDDLTEDEKKSLLIRINTSLAAITGLLIRSIANDKGVDVDSALNSIIKQIEEAMEQMMRIRRAKDN